MNDDNKIRLFEELEEIGREGEGSLDSGMYQARKDSIKFKVELAFLSPSFII